MLVLQQQKEAIENKKKQERQAKLEKEAAVKEQKAHIDILNKSIRDLKEKYQLLCGMSYRCHFLEIEKLDKEKENKEKALHDQMNKVWIIRIKI